MDRWQGRELSPITLNKYVYGNSNPVMYVDPTGELSQVAGQVAAITVLTAIAAYGVYHYAPDLNHNSIWDSILVHKLLDNLRKANYILIGLDFPQQTIVLESSPKKEKKVIKGLLTEARSHVDKITSGPAGGPTEPHWKTELKAFLQKIKNRASKRLKGKTREAILKEIDELADKAQIFLD